MPSGWVEPSLVVQLDRGCELVVPIGAGGQSCGLKQGEHQLTPPSTWVGSGTASRSLGEGSHLGIESKACAPSPSIRARSPITDGETPNTAAADRGLPLI
jgi:hypothetical protein